MKFVGERRALAAAILALYGFFYLIMVLLQPMPGWEKAYAAMAGVYGLGFFALVAGYFWARWYAVGVAISGVITAGVGMWQMGPEPILLFVGGTHLAAAVMLWGHAMSEPYDGQTSWRERFHMDDSAVQRLGRAVIRVGVSLPYVLLYALAPRPGQVAALLAFGLVAVGLRGLLQLRTWSVLAIGGGAALTFAHVCADVSTYGVGAYVVLPAVATILLVAAVVPFVAPMFRFLTARSAR
jgi:hypothetical protein